MAWFDVHRRDLPWRGIDDPYATWVSEAMLQQTRVETVIPYFVRWMERFPSIEALASAEVDDVLAAWQGLGYYRRARALHAGAKAVVADHGGALPADPAALLSLPGIGPYTAGAIASIAFSRQVPAVDGNVLRVVARLAGIDDDILSGSARRRITAIASNWVPADRPGDWNQALMELGATLCTTKAPSCETCPLSVDCIALDEGRVNELPVRARGRAKKQVDVHVLVIENEHGHVWLERRHEDGLLGGLWAPPTVEEARAGLEARGLSDAHARELGRAEHVFTHRRWQMTVHHVVTALDPTVPGRFVARAALGAVGIATAHQKALALWPAAAPKNL